MQEPLLVRRVARKANLGVADGLRGYEIAPTRSKGIQSIGIGFRVLDCLASTRKPMPLIAIAASTGMAPSKLRFYLVSFIQLGLVTQDPLSGRYSLGPHAIRLGLAALEQFDVIAASQRELHAIVDLLGYSAFLAVWGNHGPTIIFRVDGRHRTVLEIRIGSVLPLVNSAIGRVFLSYLPTPSVAEVLKAELRNGNNPSRLSMRQIDRLIRETRAAGLAVARGTLLSGFTAIAAPIMDHGGLPAAAISIIGPIGSLDDRICGKPAALLVRAAARLSEQIGWEKSGTHRKRSRSHPARVAASTNKE